MKTRDKKQETGPPRPLGYRGLLVWQKADELAYQIYVITKHYPKDEIFGLTSQMRRAAVSVPANIVEGYARNSQKEKAQFYFVARGSLTELEYFIDFSLRLKYIDNIQHQELSVLRQAVGRLLFGLVSSVSKQ